MTTRKVAHTALMDEPDDTNPFLFTVVFLVAVGIGVAVLYALAWLLLGGYAD